MRAILLVAVVACAEHSEPPRIYPQVPEDPQRPGDPQKGYDYLVNGGYITCGIPKSTYDRVFGPAGPEDTIPGRTGDNATLPYSYSAATSAEGVKIVSANCLTCHAGRVNGQLIVGLGANDGDFTSDPSAMIDLAGSLITDPTEKAEFERFSGRMHAIAPYTQMLTIGVNPADNLTAALMAHRDPATLAWSDTPLIQIPMTAPVPVDVPPWWRMKKKHAMFYTTAGRGDHARIEMTASILCTDSVDEATKIDQAFTDVRAWLETMTPPAWPFAVDMQLAARGKQVFADTCARCHGMGDDYPNVVVDDVGTDLALQDNVSQFAAPFVQWFTSSFFGQVSQLDPQHGYIAPPLDGIWATAPYLHNGSVPTIEAVLDSSKRPTYWTRTFDSTDYDQAAVGWKFTVLDHGQAAEPTAKARVKIYDTTLPGFGNGGHTFGDGLSDDDRHAVIEYLKTL